MNMESSLTGNPVLDEALRKWNAAKQRKEQELMDEAVRAGLDLGTTHQLPAAHNSEVEDEHRAKPSLGRSWTPCKAYPLHGTNGHSQAVSEAAEEVEKNQHFQRVQAGFRNTEGLPETPSTVHPLVNKERENNSCTVVSHDTTSGASRVADPGNGLSAPSVVRSAHQDKEPCTASFVTQPVHGENPADGGHPPGDEYRVIASHGEAADDEAVGELLDYLRCDFFDNGPKQPKRANKMNGLGAATQRSCARYVVNAFLRWEHNSPTEKYTLAFLSEPRFFKRSIPVEDGIEHPFYKNLWSTLEAIRELLAIEGKEVEVAPTLAHFKDSNNHAIPRAAALVFKVTDLPAQVLIRLGGNEYWVSIDNEARGSRKCKNLKGLGYWNRPRSVQQTPSRTKRCNSAKYSNQVKS